ncbi:IS4 family transposase, partial [Endozoicomonas sp.]|nr:IS4 family transposase [Endozoicomonas sp.]
MDTVSSLAQQFKPFLKWNKPRLDLLAMLIIAIVKQRTVNWTELINTFPTTTQSTSCYRRVQRFFREVPFDQNTIAFLIAHLFAPPEAWTLSMDRTNWMFGIFKINILYLAINYKGMAIPVLWVLLDKKGNSNTTERIDLMKTFQKIFPEQPVKRLLADREFKGKEWLKYLVQHNWP